MEIPKPFSSEYLKDLDSEKALEIIQDESMQLLLNTGIIAIEEYNKFYHTNFKDSREKQDYINALTFKNKLPEKK